jgi:hypothetical protein
MATNTSAISAEAGPSRSRDKGKGPAIPNDAEEAGKKNMIPCLRCLHHFADWRAGQPLADCVKAIGRFISIHVRLLLTSFESASNKCTHCKRHGKACIRVNYVLSLEGRWWLTGA